MAGIGVPELLIVLAILLLIFGPKRLPGLGRQLGGGMREFKDSITGKSSDEDDEDDDEKSARIAPPALPEAAAPAPESVTQPAPEADPAAPPRP
ncbi:MAG: twin-arginine translocase TatA/TatE family subunit [Solirubrobacterales bacterium]|jgi:sec-independent protein translocase protein TatA|nr:twin-arginine translocase TatA/TatE family subunit [Solirubrobacterales bacterium]